jgi:hypothetical protein
MAEFEFGGNWDDSWLIIKALLERADLALLADLIYQEPKPVYLSGIGNKEQLRSELKNRGIYIAGKNFSHFPPRFVQRDCGPAAGTYWINNREGGPHLSLTLPPCYLEKGMTMVGSGSLVCHDDFRNPSTRKWQKAAPELKTAYQEIKALLKKFLVRHKLPYGSIWIGRNALTMLQSGKAQLVNFLPQRGMKLVGGKEVPDPDL